jgi:hypothetical protein
MFFATEPFAPPGSSESPPPDLPAAPRIIGWPWEHPCSSIFSKRDPNGSFRNSQLDLGNLEALEALEMGKSQERSPLLYKPNQMWLAGKSQTQMEVSMGESIINRGLSIPVFDCRKVRRNVRSCWGGLAKPPMAGLGSHGHGSQRYH